MRRRIALEVELIIAGVSEDQCFAAVAHDDPSPERCLVCFMICPWNSLRASAGATAGGQRLAPILLDQENSMPFEILYRALVLLCRGASGNRFEIAAPAGLWTRLA